VEAWWVVHGLQGNGVEIGVVVVCEKENEQCEV